MRWSLAGLAFLALTVVADVKYLCKLPKWGGYSDPVKAEKDVCEKGDLVGTGKHEQAREKCKTTGDNGTGPCKKKKNSLCFVFDCDATTAPTPPTPNPTIAPTPSPTTAAPTSPPLPVLVIKKITGVPGPDPTDLRECEGDCDSDKDCVDGFRCFQRIKRNKSSPVPGCTGEDDKKLNNEDFCFDQKDYPDYFFISTIKGTQAENLDACQGHCDSDDDCADAQQECRPGALITGCKGKQVKGYSYCTSVVEATAIITQDYEVYDAKPFDPEEVETIEGYMEEIIAEITSDPSIKTTVKVISQSLCPQNQATCTTRRKLYTSSRKLPTTTTNEVTFEVRSTSSGDGDAEAVADEAADSIDPDKSVEDLTNRGVDQLMSAGKPVVLTSTPTPEPTMSMPLTNARKLESANKNEWGPTDWDPIRYHMISDRIAKYARDADQIN